MPSADLLTAFALATLVFAVMPGPAILYTAAQTIAGGRRAGFRAVAGIHLGCYAHILAATFGLSAIFAAAPNAYFALKLAGAAYLVFLGARMILAKDGAGNAAPLAAKSARRAFLDSVIVELLNPKVALFFIAFLPQFVDPTASLPVWAQFLILGVIVNFSFSTTDLITVMAADRVTRAAKRSSLGVRVARMAGGATLTALGAHLALSRS